VPIIFFLISITGFLCKDTVFIFNVVLYGYENWSLTLREKHRLRMFENRVLKKIFGRKRDEGTGERRRVHNEDLHEVYFSLNIFRKIKLRRMRWAYMRG
jgi:hypothetical protein